MKSSVRENPRVMDDLMSEIDVAEFSDVELVLPHLILDAVVDLEAPMKAVTAATSTKSGSNFANIISIHFSGATCLTLRVPIQR